MNICTTSETGAPITFWLPSTIFPLHSGKVKEDLLKSGLADGVVFDAAASLGPLHGPKDLGPCELCVGDVVVDHALMLIFQFAACINKQQKNKKDLFIKGHISWLSRTFTALD